MQRSPDRRRGGGFVVVQTIVSSIVLAGGAAAGAAGVTSTPLTGLSFCDVPDFHETQNLDPTPVTGNFACVNDQPEGPYSSDNVFARVYTMPEARNLTCVEVGIEANTSSVSRDVTIRVLRLSADTDPPRLANVIGTVASREVSIPPGFGPARATGDFQDLIPLAVGEVILCEVAWAATTPGADPVGALIAGGNPLGQTRPVYIRSIGCGIGDYLALEDLGFPDATIIDYRAAFFEGCFGDAAGPGGPGWPDGNIDALDFLLQLSEWGSPCVPTDIDPPGPGPEDRCFSDVVGPGGPGVPDGNVDALDNLLLLAEWGNPCNPVP